MDPPTIKNSQGGFTSGRQPIVKNNAKSFSNYGITNRFRTYSPDDETHYSLASVRSGIPGLYFIAWLKIILPRDEEAMLIVSGKAGEERAKLRGAE